MKISAYIPCFNNEKTIAQAIASVQGQSHPVDELVVIDDGSSDHSIAEVARTGVDLIRHESNLGRGAARSIAMSQLQGELVLCCDATNLLEPDFLAKALPWFEDPSLGAVFGKIVQPEPKNAVERWRGRHLFKLGIPHELRHKALLVTWGAVVRRSAALEVGNYATNLRQGEDAELGKRLIEAGHDVVYDPRLSLSSIAENTLSQVLERYWRWNAHGDEACTWLQYMKNTSYTLKVMVPNDLREGDLLGAFISLLCPHYQFWKSRRHHASLRSNEPR